MGMYDSVIREPIKCPGCGKELHDFQSKSGFKCMLKVTPEQLVEDCNRMWGEGVDVEYYDYCLGPEGCGGRVTFTYDRGRKEWVQSFMTGEEIW